MTLLSWLDERAAGAARQGRRGGGAMRRGLLAVAVVGLAVGQARGTLVITPTFDSSITGNPNAAVLEADINTAIGIYRSLFSDPITVSIDFRYATTRPNGTPLAGNTL